MNPADAPQLSDPESAAPRLQNVNVTGLDPLLTPRGLDGRWPVPERAYDTVRGGRQTIEAILRGEDRRLLVVVGPCSIHDPVAARDYAARLARLHHDLAQTLYIVMRVYFEKPRTTVGWKGLINDPHLDGSFDMPEGLRLARQLLLEVAELGLPTGTEFLDPVTPQYLDDLVAWAAIGARTTESQTHRQMASGLSMPVGYKNSTTGQVQVAIDAMNAARHPHHFVGIDETGRACVVQTLGNPDGHLILRGGAGKPNYHPDSVADAAKQLADAGLAPRLMVDCSHANSGKKHQQQATVWNSLIQQRLKSTAQSPSPVCGAMLESFIEPGNQKIPADRTQLTYGQSITDACIDWDQTQKLLKTAAARLA
jgi:3-deoxy-7-phosphoheptulonate synthase